ncbi:dimethylargininase [Kribbella antiqua]|uniref:Dimethylargininase n=1 Tax=Kribbella antiqua TaxID=2512217 RepID=A0A4R2J0G2_9ACTN|nr:dimethylargininase [Kribbella antiqua]TCO51217.1 dimethylargininase [Kribbella antiqua]
MPTALVRRPSPRLADGLVTHIERTPVDAELAVRQWQQYVDALEATGWTTVEVPAIDECPDGVFIEDTMVVYGDLAVIARAGADERRPEAATAEATVAGQGYRIAHIEEPGTLDGGDILKIGSIVYAGLGGRTNEEGIRQLGAALQPLGADVRAVPVSKVLHLKSAVTALPDGTVIGYEPLVDDPTAFEAFKAVPEESGAHVVLLGEGRLLMAASAPRSVELFKGMGYTPVVVDIGEFEKLEGCVTCLSVRLRG